MKRATTDRMNRKLPRGDGLRNGAVCAAALLALQLAALQFSPLQMSSAQAQGQAQPPANDRARALLQQRERWDALPEADRKAIQDSLVWLGLYNGVVDGAFGQRSADAIGAFEKRNLLPPGNVISGPGLAVLRAAANKEKAALGFKLLNDPATGARIGFPAQLLDRRESAPGRTRLASSRSPASLTLFAGGPEDGDLPAWFERTTAATAPGRKITYKILRPDFAVVTGNEGDRRFFTRVASGPTGLRGFTFVYPAASAAAMDRLTIAIANSFEPFASEPGAAASASASAVASAGAEIRAAALPASAPSPLSGTALLVSPGRAITATAAIRGCRDIRIGDAPATVTASNATSGLSLLAAPGLKMTGQAPVVLASTPQTDGPLILATYAADADGKPNLSVATGETSGAQGRIVAALQDGGPGSLVLDRSGGLAGIVSGQTESPAISGVKLAAAHPFAQAEALTRMLNDAGAAPVASDRTEPQSAGAAIARWRARLAPVSCLAAR